MLSICNEDGIVDPSLDDILVQASEDLPALFKSTFYDKIPPKTFMK